MLRGFWFMLLSRTGLLRVVTHLMLDRRVPIKAKVAVPLALVYLISPIDIVLGASMMQLCGFCTKSLLTSSSSV